MRIGFDLRYVHDHFPGIGRYSADLALALAELQHGHTLVLIANPTVNPRYNLARLYALPQVEVVPCTVSPFSAAEQWVIPRLARQQRLDLLHSPYYVKPYLGLPCPSIVTIYDLISRHFPQTLSQRGRLLFELTMALAVRTSQAIITISESARDDLIQAYRLPHERIAVTPLAASSLFTPQPSARIATLRQRLDLPTRYVLYLGSNKTHKNIERLVRAWEQLLNAGDAGIDNDLILVVAGHQVAHGFDTRAFANERGIGARIKLIPNVSDADLPTLYSGAEIFAFPSYYEGFGLPPLEAMACGTPVLCAHASSLPEVVGDAALTVDPYSVAAIAEGLRTLLTNHQLRSQLREAGLRRAHEFSWQRTAVGTLAVYTRCVHSKAPKARSSIANL